MRFKRRKKIVNYPFNWLNIVKDTNQTLFFSDWHQLIQSVHGIQGCVYAPVSSFLIFQYFSQSSIISKFFVVQNCFQGRRNHWVLQKSKRSWSNRPGKTMVGTLLSGNIWKEVKDWKQTEIVNDEIFNFMVFSTNASIPASKPCYRTNLLGKQQTTINFLYCFHLCPVSWSILRFFLSRLKAATTCKKEKSSQSNSFQFHLLDPNLSSTRRTTSEFFPLDIFHLGAIINHGQKTTTNNQT